MNDQELAIAQDRLLTASRDLIRAHKQNIDLRPFLSILENAASAFADTEFDDWCEDVDRIVQAALADRVVTLERWYDWDYPKYFHEGLTTIQAADKLQSYLLSEP